MDGFPEKYQILSPTAERVLEVCGKMKGFLFGTIRPETAYPSDHRRVPEPSDGETIQPELPFEPQTPTSDFYPPFIDRSRA